jgi:hypothetical protein
MTHDYEGPHGGNVEHHKHEALVHEHPHFHVTHNYNKLTGGFDHLYSEHEHEHDHPAIAHTHVPHQDFESEHHGEAHVHDHGEPVRTAKKAAGKKAVGKKASAKKAKARKKASQ